MAILAFWKGRALMSVFTHLLLIVMINAIPSIAKAAARPLMRTKVPGPASQALLGHLDKVRPTCPFTCLAL